MVSSNVVVMVGVVVVRRQCGGGGDDAGKMVMPLLERHLSRRSTPRFRGTVLGTLSFQKFPPVCGPVLGTLSFQMFSLYVWTLTGDFEISKGSSCVSALYWGL